MAHDTREDVDQVRVGVDARLLAGLDEGVDGRGGLAAAHAAGEEPVPAANGHGADRDLAGVVMERDASIVQEDAQVGALILEVLAGLAHLARLQVQTAQADELLLPVIQRLRTRLLSPGQVPLDGQPFVGGLLLDVEELADMRHRRHRE